MMVCFDESFTVQSLNYAFDLIIVEPQYPAFSTKASKLLKATSLISDIHAILICAINVLKMGNNG
jgi:hypothetical protein